VSCIKDGQQQTDVFLRLLTLQWKNLLTTSLEALQNCKHDFMAYLQSVFIQEIKRYLTDVAVVAASDFAKNYSFIIQDAGISLEQ
jgi:hypothetical protein